VSGDADQGPTLDRFCQRYGIRLMAWQRELAERALSGEQLTWQTGRRPGKEGLDRMLHAYSYYRDGWQDGTDAADGT